MSLQLDGVSARPEGQLTGCFGQRLSNKKLSFLLSQISSFFFFVNMFVISGAEHFLSSSVTHCSVNAIVDYKKNRRQKH